MSLLNPQDRQRTKDALVAKLAEHSLKWGCAPSQAAEAFAPCAAPGQCLRQFRIIHAMENIEFINQDEFARLDLERVPDADARLILPSFDENSMFMFSTPDSGAFYVVH